MNAIVTVYAEDETAHKELPKGFKFFDGWAAAKEWVDEHDGHYTYKQESI